MMRAADLRSAVFVSDRQHMLRVLRMAADQGIVGWGSPTETSPLEGDPLARLDATVHELGQKSIGVGARRDDLQNFPGIVVDLDRIRRHVSIFYLAGWHLIRSTKTATLAKTSSLASGDIFFSRSPITRPNMYSA